jgi:hypothetical protein
MIYEITFEVFSENRRKVLKKCRTKEEADIFLENIKSHVILRNINIEKKFIDERMKNFSKSFSFS